MRVQSFLLNARIHISRLFLSLRLEGKRKRPSVLFFSIPLVHPYAQQLLTILPLINKGLIITAESPCHPGAHRKQIFELTKTVYMCMFVSMYVCFGERVYRLSFCVTLSFDKIDNNN